jgi:hypothetical protein
MLSIVGRVPQLTNLPIPFILGSGSRRRNTVSEMTIYTSIMTRFFIFSPLELVDMNSFSYEHGKIATSFAFAT